VVSLEIEADLLTLDEFAHSGALDGGDMDEGVSAAIIGLNEAEALGGIEPFNCASGHDEPFHSNIEKPQGVKAMRMVVTIFERKFVQAAVLIAR
jgi:hypothetical protein